jgi:hypothetical protein
MDTENQHQASGIYVDQQPQYYTRFNNKNNGFVIDPYVQNAYKYHNRFAYVYGMNQHNQYLIQDLGNGTAIDQTNLIYKIDIEYEETFRIW